MKMPAHKRRFRKPEHIKKKQVKKDSNRYFVEKLWTWVKFKLLMLERVEFFIDTIQDKHVKIQDC